MSWKETPDPPASEPASPSLGEDLPSDATWNDEGVANVQSRAVPSNRSTLFHFIQGAVVGLAHWLAKLPLWSGSWTSLIIVFAIVLVGLSVPALINGLFAVTLGIMLLVYFLCDDRGTALWAIAGCLLAFAVINVDQILWLKLAFPMLMIAMLVWCIWRWIVDVKSINDKYGSEGTGDRIGYRHMAAELVFVVLLLISVVSSISWGITQQPFFAMVWEATASPPNRVAAGLDTVLEVGWAFRIGVPGGIIFVALVLASLDTAGSDRVDARPMPTAHPQLYEFRANLRLLWEHLQKAATDLLSYVLRVWESFKNILRWNFELLRHMVSDFVFCGPGALILGASFFLGIHVLTDNGWIAALVGPILIAGGAGTLAMIAQYRHVSLDRSDETTTPTGVTFISGFLINVVRVWGVLLLALGIHYCLNVLGIVEAGVPLPMLLATLKLLLLIALIAFIGYRTKAGVIIDDALSGGGE